MKKKDAPAFIPEKWYTPTNQTIACEEKIKVLNENLAEIGQLCQDALDDAVIMGCDENYTRQVFISLIESLNRPFAS